MRIRAFLSHKRQDQADVAALRAALKVYGAGGYKDTEDLRLGVRTDEELRRAIHETTGGFIWWGTRRALGSACINELEIPSAVIRASANPPYPIVPLFIDLTPSADGAAIRLALGDHADDFLAHNGVVLERGEDPLEFRKRVARRYVGDAIAGFSDGPLTVAFRALSEPDGVHDLTFDWRALVDSRRRVLVPSALDTMIDALANTREAAQAKNASPEIYIESDLPLPLAYLVGYEWRITTRTRLELNQRTGSTFRRIRADGPTALIAPAVVNDFGRDGPVVVVVSCGSKASGAASRYADTVAASRTATLHIDGLLDDGHIRGLARAAASELRAANDLGCDKHLLILGPTALAVLVGAATNACGPVVIPFWDGATYVSPIAVG